VQLQSKTIQLNFKKLDRHINEHKQRHAYSYRWFEVPMLFDIRVYLQAFGLSTLENAQYSNTHKKDDSAGDDEELSSNVRGAVLLGRLSTEPATGPRAGLISISTRRRLIPRNYQSAHLQSTATIAANRVEAF